MACYESEWTRVMFDLQFPIDEIEHWSSKYGYGGDDAIKDGVGPRAKNRGYLTKPEFLKICYWKTPRSRSKCDSNPPGLIREATRLAFSAKSELLRIGVLDLLQGVGWPTASTILHFCHSDQYPILDYRALWSLGVDAPPAVYRFDFWWEYVTTCRSLARESRVTMRVLDRALWQYSRNNQ